MNTVHIRNTGFSLAQDGRPSDGAATTRTTYQIDPVASRVEFTIRKRLLFVKHMLITGRFADVQGTIRLDEQEPTNSQAEVTIGAASVNTQMGSGRLDLAQALHRDEHLRKADFFDVERYPHLTFTSRRIEAVDRAAGSYRVTGDLTVRDVTREVTLEANYSPAVGEGPARRIVLTLTGPLNRRDFGMVWNRPYVAVADDLTVTLEVEATPS